MFKTSQKVLDRHVRESNRIEGITAQPGKPLYDQHLAAARMVSLTEKYIDPRELHKVLFAGIEGYDAGEYRKVPIWVGETCMPPHEEVPKLMNDWFLAVSLYMAGTAPFEEPSVRNTVLLHDWFLCIHPFVDGNGRTARLIFNMLRKLTGMPWIIVRKSQSDDYMIRIKAWEKHVFRKIFWTDQHEIQL